MRPGSSIMAAGMRLVSGLALCLGLVACGATRTEGPAFVAQR